MDFLLRTQMIIDVFSRTYCFGFAPCKVGSFSVEELEPRPEPYLQQLCGEVANFTTLERKHTSHLNQAVLMKEFSSLFSASLGVAKCTPY